MAVVPKIFDQIDFYRSTGTFLFNPATVVTAAKPERLLVGDYDGDGRQDVAFLERADSLSPELVNLNVAFGSDSVFEDPVQMATFESFDTMTTFQLDFNAISDLLVFASPRGQPPEGTILLGDAGRRMLAPLTVVREVGDNEELDQAVVAYFAEFSSGPAAAFLGLCDPSVCTGSDEGTPRLWFAVGDGAGSLDIDIEASGVPIPSTVVEPFADLQDFNSRLGELGAASPDVNNNGNDAIAILGGTKGKLFVAEPSGSSDECSLTVPPPVLVGRMLEVDVDGDEYEDLVVVVSGPDETTTLVVLMSDGSSVCSEQLTLVLGSRGDVAAVYGFAAPSEDDLSDEFDFKRDLIVATSAGVYRVLLVTADDGTRSLALADEPLVPDVFAAIRVGDVNGDGVSDLVGRTDRFEVVLYLGLDIALGSR